MDDTLNIKAGMNYAQFLSAVLRIGYIKAEQSGDQTSSAYKNALDVMFQSSNIDISKRQIEDPVLSAVYSSEIVKAFFQSEVILCAVFTARSLKLGDTFLQMPKENFVQLMREIGILIDPKKKSSEEDKKEKEAKDKKAQGGAQGDKDGGDSDVFAEEEVMNVIRNVNTFDADHLDYYNFLECIVRVAKARPWSEEEEKEFPDLPTQLEKICFMIQQLADQDDTLDNFEKQREKFEAERRYQPRVVVDDEEGDLDYEDDDMQ